jgi:predicted Zn-dependent peptidase
MPEVRWTEVDGVATVWAEAPGPLEGTLLFRTGLADETLVTAGQTHLVEHLALSTIPDPARRHGGFVSGTTTGFHTRGRPDEVATFLAQVCRALGALPEERLEAEKQVLGAEAAGRPFSVWGRLLAWRYGAVGHGLLGLPEYGVQAATAEQLRTLVAHRLTRGNAVLSLSGPPPAGLRLDLPPGHRQPPPALAPMLPEFPCWCIDDQTGGVAASATLPRVAASTLLCAVASERLHARLRLERAVSYAPGLTYEPQTADRAHVLLYADSNQARRVELTAAFVDVLAGLAEVGEAEVAATRQRVVADLREELQARPDRGVQPALQRAAGDRLLGRPPASLEQVAAEVAAATAEEVASLGRGLRDEALVALPSNAPAPPWVGSRAPVSMASAVQGREVAHLDAPIQPQRLVHSAEGVTLRGANGQDVTVRYAELSAGLSFGDGAVVLIGREAFHLSIEPTLWRHGGRLCEEIRARVPPALLLQREARPPGAIPRPATTGWQRFRARAGQLGRRGARAARMAWAVAAFLVALVLGGLLLGTDRSVFAGEISVLARVALFLAVGYLFALGRRR